MTCDLCEGRRDYSGCDHYEKMFVQENPLISHKKYLHVWIEDVNGVFDIKYCPLCGRKLDEE